MEGEMINFIKLWFIVLISLCYCYGIGKYISAGFLRLIFIFPIISLFFYLPLFLSSPHLCGFTAFFIAWLANFKLLLFSFNHGPLSSNPSLSLRKFLAVSCLPIKIQQNPSQETQIEKYPSSRIENQPPKSFLSYAIKALVIALMVKLYDYSEFLHPKTVLFIYSWHIFFLLEIILAVSKFLAMNLIGIELEPQFNDPYFSTSLQDFWGRRWNLMVTSILRPTIYNPTIKFITPFVGRKLAPLPAVIGTFLVSALMHEIVFYYLGRMKPTGEITLFFIIHGIALTLEILVKKMLPEKWRLPPVISVPATVGFVFATALWLFFPQFVRLKIDAKAFEDYAAMSALLKNLFDSLFKELNVNY